MKLEGKVAVITGSASGIGRATARLFAKEGAKIVIADIKDREGNETVQLIKEAGGEAVFTHVNVVVVTELERMIKVAVETYGRLDIFFHSAGIAGPGRRELTSEETYDLTMAVNLKAGFFGAKYAAPELGKAGGGCILFISSGAGLRPSPAGSPSYAVSKAGVIMLTRDLALYLAKDNIRVNCISPGPTNTQILQDAISRDVGQDPEQVKRGLLERQAIKRLAMPEEIARAALFLASPQSSFITGITLCVDGGIAAG